MTADAFLTAALVVGMVLLPGVGWLLARESIAHRRRHDREGD